MKKLLLTTLFLFLTATVFPAHTTNTQKEYKPETPILQDQNNNPINVNPIILYLQDTKDPSKTFILWGNKDWEFRNGGPGTPVFRGNRKFFRLDECRVRQTDSQPNVALLAEGDSCVLTGRATIYYTVQGTIFVYTINDKIVD